MNGPIMRNTMHANGKVNVDAPIKRYPADNAASTALDTTSLPIILNVPTATFPHDDICKTHYQ